MESLSLKPDKKGSKVLCYACLTSDRRLFALTKSADYINIWRKLVQGATSEVSLCWECLALLKNVKKFQEKVKISQTMLKETGGSEKYLLNSLSHLSTTEPNIIDSEIKSLNIENLMDEIKPDFRIIDTELNLDEIDSLDDYIKTVTEINQGDDEISNIFFTDVILDESKEINPPEDYFKVLEYTQDFLTEDSIKFENELLLEDANFTTEKPININFLELAKKKVKSEKVKKRKGRIKHYKLEKVMVNHVDVYTRLPISPLEVHDWMKKERNSPYFKNMRSKCVQCAMRISKKNLKSHMASHSKNNNFTCDVCKCTFMTKKKLVQHIKNHNYIRSCNMCGFKCIHKLHMYRHIKKEHSKVVECLECHKRFRSTREFYIHYNESCRKFNKTFICDYCKKNFIQKRTIEKHISRHHTRQFCSECNLTFSTWSKKKDHMESQHRIDRTEAAYCVQCDKQFDNIKKFQKHFYSYAVHTNERKRKELFSCPVCGNNYARKKNMKNHYNKEHAEVPRFQCTDCGKTFLTNASLKSHHMYVHQGFAKKKDKMCTFCGRGFVSWTDLKKHIRTHTGERPYQCPHCASSFAQRTPMLTHIKNIHNKGHVHGQPTLEDRQWC